MLEFQTDSAVTAECYSSHRVIRESRGTKLISKHLPLWLLKSEITQTLFKKIVLISKNLFTCMGILSACCLWIAYEQYPQKPDESSEPSELRAGVELTWVLCKSTSASNHCGISPAQFKLLNTHFPILLEPGGSTVL